MTELHWYEAHGIGKKEIKRKKYLEQVMRKSTELLGEFVVCINNVDYPASLELHKIYRVIPDKDAATEGDIELSALRADI